VIDLWGALQGIWIGLGTLTQVAMIAWVATMVAMPIANWLWGDRALRLGIAASVALQALAVLAALGSHAGWGRAAGLAIGIVVMGWVVEYVGSTTGFPFGRYHYTDRLRPQLGHVPLLVPVAWMMMLPPAWSIAQAIVPHRGPLRILIGALAFTAWDLYLDPQMVNWRLWIWERRGAYFGVPWVNFAGWFLASGLMTAILQPGDLPTGPLQLIYVTTWLLQVVGLGVFWRQPGPAACGFLAMGTMVAWALLAGR
jgi:putative membrane protein